MKRIILSVITVFCFCQILFAQKETENYELLKGAEVINYSLDFSVFQIEKSDAEDYIEVNTARPYNRFQEMVENSLISKANLEMKSSNFKLTNETESDLELKIILLTADDDGEHTLSIKLYHKPSNTYIYISKINTNGGDNDNFISEFMKRLNKTGKKIGNKMVNIKRWGEYQKDGTVERY